MKIADVMVKVLLHVSQQIVDNPMLPGEFKNGLKDVSKIVDSLKGDLLKDGGKGLQNALSNLPDLSKDAGKSVQDVTKGLQNLIPGNKPQPATQPK
jgi:hypothetical protein